MGLYAVLSQKSASIMVVTIEILHRLPVLMDHLAYTAEMAYKTEVSSFLYEPCHEKTCFCHMRTTKAQISLRIRAV